MAQQSGEDYQHRARAPRDYHVLSNTLQTQGVEDHRGEPHHRPVQNLGRLPRRVGSCSVGLERPSQRWDGGGAMGAVLR